MLAMELISYEIEVIPPQHNLIETTANDHKLALTGAKSSLPVDEEHFKDEGDPYDEKLYPPIVGTLLFVA